jgi:hypothetical protein
MCSCVDRHEGLQELSLSQSAHGSFTEMNVAIRIAAVEVTVRARERWRMRSIRTSGFSIIRSRGRKGAGFGVVSRVDPAPSHSPLRSHSTTKPPMEFLSLHHPLRRRDGALLYATSDEPEQSDRCDLLPDQTHPRVTLEAGEDQRRGACEIIGQSSVFSSASTKSSSELAFV